MASALELTAKATLINGQGLTANPDLLAAIEQFHTLPTVILTADSWMVASASLGNTTIIPVLRSIGSGVAKNNWLLDAYNPQQAPACSIQYAAWALDSSSYITVPVIESASFSGTVYTQARAPFQFGVKEFANVFVSSYSYASKTFDTLASTNVLADKTYGKSGLGYKNTTDLATAGIGASAPILANAISHWGTMYDVTNISKMNDPYVFGQNLLAQGLGKYGNWDKELAAVGLDPTNLTAIPRATTVSTAQPSAISTTTPLGAVDILGTSTQTVVNVVPGSSPDVVLNIYSKVTGSNLAAIVSGTRFTDITTTTSLKDYLDIAKVVPPNVVTQLAKINIKTFTDLSRYLQSKIGQGSFSSWQEVAQLLNQLDVPTQKFTPATTNNSSVLSDSTKSTLLNSTGNGHGPLSNHIMQDFLGAAAGVPYIEQFAILNNTYSRLPIGGLLSALTTLHDAVLAWDGGIASVDDGMGGMTTTFPDTSAVAAAVVLVNQAMNALPTIGDFASCQAAYDEILSRMNFEVGTLALATATFDNNATQRTLDIFADQFVSYATDKIKVQSYPIIKNLIANDHPGDTLRAAISESINTTLLGSKGIEVKNNPNPSLAIGAADQKGISVNAYLATVK